MVEVEALGAGGERGLVDLVGLLAPRLAEHGVDENPQGVGVVLGAQELGGQFAPCRVRQEARQCVNSEAGVSGPPRAA